MLPPAGPCPWPRVGSAATASKTSASTTTSGSARAGGGTTPGRRHRPFFGQDPSAASPKAGEKPAPPPSTPTTWVPRPRSRWRSTRVDITQCGEERPAHPGPGWTAARPPPAPRQGGRGGVPADACATSASLAAKLHSPTDAAQRDRDQPAHPPGMTLEPQPPALLSARNRLRRAMRRGASWTVAYHLQLTVAAVAGPVRGSVVPSGSLLLGGPGLLLAQTASARRGVQPTSSGQASSPGRHCQGASHGVGRRSVSSIGCPPIRCRRPGSGSPAVRCPARPVSGHLGWSSGCPAVRSSAVHPSGVRPSGVRPSGVRPLVSDRPASSWLVSTPVGPDASRPLPSRAVALGPGRCGGYPSPRERVESRWAAAPLSGSVEAQQAWTRAVLPSSRVGQRECRWRTRAGFGTAAARARCAARQARPACGAPGGWRRREGTG
jgi:hypothetical protein